MGNDGVAVAEVLTTAMNQYGVSLDDPMEASRKMVNDCGKKTTTPTMALLKSFLLAVCC